MKRLGVLMIREEIALTTGMMNCRMFLRGVLPFWPWSLAASFSIFFWAPFLARCKSCLAMVASVLLEEGMILTGFILRGLCLTGASFSSLGSGGAPSFSFRILWAFSSGEPAMRSGAGLRRSEEGGLPLRRTMGTPPFLPSWSFPDLNLDFRGESLPALSFLIFAACWKVVDGARFIFLRPSFPSFPPFCASGMASLGVTLNFILERAGGLPRLFSPLFKSLFFTCSMDTDSALLGGEHAGEDSGSPSEPRSKLFRGLPRGLRVPGLAEAAGDLAGL